MNASIPERHDEKPDQDSRAESHPLDSPLAARTEDRDSSDQGSETNNRPAKPSRFWSNPNHWIAIATIVGAFANGLYTYYASQQWAVMSG